MTFKISLALALTLAMGVGCYGSTGGNDGGAGFSGSAGTSSGKGGGSATGGSSSGGTSNGGKAGAISGGGSSAYDCNGDQSFVWSVNKDCATAEDCVLVNHTSSCCGDVTIMAINGGAERSFSAAETYCDSLLPACGCAAQGVSAEDGTIVEFGSENLIAAQCNDGFCSSHYTGTSFQCGVTTCTQDQYCMTANGGPQGAEPTNACYFSGGCTSCDCVGVGTECGCAVTDGHITVTCNYP